MKLARQGLFLYTQDLVIGVSTPLDPHASFAKVAIIGSKMPQQLRVPKISDRNALEFASKAAILANCPNFTLQLFGRPQLSVPASLDLADGEGSDYLAWLKRSNGYAILEIVVSFQNFALVLKRQNQPNGSEYIFDYVEVNNDHRNLSDSLVVDLNDLIWKTFLAGFETATIAFKDEKYSQTLLQSHAAMVERLQGMVVDIGERATEVRLQLDEDFSARKGDLETQFEMRQTEAQKTVEEQRRLLDEKAEEIRLRTAALDDRSNTHARRALHESLKTRIADRFKKLDLTPQTKNARWPIHIAVVVSGAILGSLIYTFTSEALAVLAKPDPGYGERLLVIAKSATASLGFLGIITWYLRWLNRWFERLADTEFQLKQFELDINRAQWVVETAFEWKISQDAPIPDQLLENISRNLFARAEKDENADMHPADYLASALIGRASNVKLAVPGGEIEFAKGALKPTAG